MKLLIKLAFVSFCLSATTGYSVSLCSDADLSLAQDLYDAVKKQYEASVATGPEVKVAEGALLDTKLCADKIDLNNYCAQKNALLLDLVKNGNAGAGVAVGSIEYAASTIKELVALRKTCKGRDY